ncbi:sigma-54 interaction domain-containing protein [Halalkalibacter krulwichiae]|uniref:Arginine utilization regulatory protein RocR n=1 Tax=Halalkalibacter krulwichiae TaxID=199441 RepID=A0A1X9MEH6_9BACI|nr:sigma 54-interacting transcriptional regulator [Halalkalibacter krulwichiae]ARK31838.1 Arginine utilization regulatory protein RocR [Halalkalibacter krulwichiae]
MTPSKSAVTDQMMKIYETLVNEIDVGVHAINSSGKTIIYNEKMMEIESLSKEEVFDKDFLDIFTFEEGQRSTLLEALFQKKEFNNVRQTYFTKNGKAITTINHTFPIYDQTEVIGAIEIAKDVTKIENLIKNNLKVKGDTRFTFESLIGESHAIKEVIDIAKRATRTPSSILIIGETGTGKELFAQSIHNGSEHSSGPFISQNCAAMPDTLIESLLFGTKKGAFTGATDQIGLFEQAEGGTLLLDEINSLSPMLQAKLLRAIQEKSIRRIGDTVNRKVNVRIIATINEDPVEAIANDRLRKDLYYRLSVVSLFIPPMRDRKDDIPLLVRSFIEKYNHIFQMDVAGVSEEVLQIFNQYDWPGNVREIEHVIEASMNVLVGETMIDVTHLPHHFKNKSTFSSQGSSIIGVYNTKSEANPETEGPIGAINEINPSAPVDNLKEFLLKAESYYIKKALEKHKYHKTNAAAELGLSRQTLQYRIKRLNIDA